MTPSPGPIQPHHAGSPSRVIQGFFPGGRPRIVQASPAPVAPARPQVPAPVQARPGSPPAPLLPGRPVIGALQPLLRPGQPPRPILPTKVQPGAVQPATPLRPQVPQPILPQRATPTAVQPHAGGAFPLPGNFTLKPRGSGQPLPEPIQKKMEAFFNTSFADVRVHVGPEASSIGALAFTHGTDLYFVPGQYNPQSPQGQQLLGHELTHVVQQRAGRVRNPLGAGVAVVQDPALEAEAERMGLRAASAAAPVQARMLGASLVGTVPGQSVRPVPVQPKGVADGVSAGPIHVWPPTQAGENNHRLVAGVGGQPVGSVMAHARGDSAIEVTDLKADPSQTPVHQPLQCKTEVLEASGRSNQRHVVIPGNSLLQNQSGFPREIHSISFMHLPASIQPAKTWASVAKTVPPPSTPKPTPKPTPTFIWVILQSATNHYRDGWLKEFEISSDEDLIAEVTHRGLSFQEGEHRIALGMAMNKGKSKFCHIMYRCDWQGMECTVTVWHCGPNAPQSKQGLGETY